MIPVCKTFEELRKHDGQLVQVFGRLARSYELPQQPYILLLPDNRWIFLGSEKVLETAGKNSTYLLVEGHLSMENPNFNLAEFSNTPSVFPAQESVANPEQLIQSQPAFTQINFIQNLPHCQTTEEVRQHSDQWIVIHGLLSFRKTQMQFQTSKKNPWLQLAITAGSTDGLQKRNAALVVVKCGIGETEIHASHTLLHWVYPQVNSRSSVVQHQGQMVAMSGRLRLKKGSGAAAFPVLKLAPKTFLYLSAYSADNAREKYLGKKVRLVGQVLDEPPFFLPELAVFRPGVAMAYVNTIMWLDRK